MEPAFDRREHLEWEIELTTKAAPQWSPPLTGGSTLDTAIRAVLDTAAAMEPAAERREHGGHVGLRGGRVIAAMEPAVDRREHGVRRGICGAGRVPQWSLPLTGGSTRPQDERGAGRWVPQWSPPSNGGSTPIAREGRERRPDAAMEPAAERREHPELRVAPRTSPRAAMEPAAERREHTLRSPGPFDRARLPAMEPAVPAEARTRVPSLDLSKVAIEPAGDRREPSAPPLVESCHLHGARR